MVTDVITQLQGTFGKEAPLTITCGKVHDYLGMVLDYSAPGKVKFSMTDYNKMMLANLPDEMSGEASTPAAAHLFETNGTGSTLLDEEQADMFHDNVAKLLFLCKQRRTRPNIQTAVAFLCTQAHHVKGPDTDDY